VRYLVKVSFSNPEGSQEGVEYWETEEENTLSAWLSADFGDYVKASLIGTVTVPRKPWIMAEILKEIKSP
jgi:hypothetical protein